MPDIRNTKNFQFPRHQKNSTNAVNCPQVFRAVHVLYEHDISRNNLSAEIKIVSLRETSRTFILTKRKKGKKK